MFLLVYLISCGTSMMAPLQKTRLSVAEFLEFLCEYSPSFDLTLNPKKGKVFWPSGESDFCDLPPEVSHASPNGVKLMEVPILGVTRILLLLSLTFAESSYCLGWRIRRWSFNHYIIV